LLEALDKDALEALDLEFEELDVLATVEEEPVDCEDKDILDTLESDTELLELGEAELVDELLVEEELD
jgi:hypothetical protein